MQPDVFNDDALGDEINTLLEGKVGLPPESQDELDKIYKEGDIRFGQKRPPGYIDYIEKSKQNKSRICLYGGLVFKREYGDWILWSQIIKEAETRNLKYIIFVTSDKKEDWWFIESRGKRTIGPRPELVEEIHSKAGVSLFYMYNTERFLEFSEEYLGVKIKQESINQVRDFAQILKERSLFDLPENYPSEIAVFHWLESLAQDNEIITRNIYPDFIVENKKDTTKVGYELMISFNMNPKILGYIINKLKEKIKKGHFEIISGKLNEFKIVLIVKDMNSNNEIARMIEKEIEFPERVSVIVGLLKPTYIVEAPYIFDLYSEFDNKGSITHDYYVLNGV